MTENINDRHLKGRTKTGAIRKLSLEEVAEIRKIHIPHKHGKNNAYNLAKRFGVHHVTILDIIKGRSYTHVALT